MNRKTLIALGAFIVLGALAIFSVKQPEKGNGPPTASVPSRS